MRPPYPAILILLTLLILLIILFVCLFSPRKGKESKESKESKQTHEKNNRIAVVYCYYEKNDLYKENLRYFLTHGLKAYPNSGYHIDYVLVINGNCTVDIPSRPDLTVIRRENRGYDFGGWSHGLKRLPHPSYDYYFFLNTSVRGPYLGSGNIAHWLDCFLPLFTAGVKVVGTSINVYRQPSYDYHVLSKYYGKGKKVFPHVQSMFFGIDRKYKLHLDSVGFFDEGRYDKMNFSDVIAYAEIGLSQIALMKGWNINCVLPHYRGLDYTRIQRDPNESSRDGDPYYPGCYFGGTIKPEEAVFFKSWRLA